MNVQQAQTTLSKALGIDVEKLAKANPALEHNMKEEWRATTEKVAEFVTKYAPPKD